MAELCRGRPLQQMSWLRQTGELLVPIAASTSLSPNPMHLRINCMESRTNVLLARRPFRSCQRTHHHVVLCSSMAE